MECKCYIKEEDGIEPQLIKCPLCKSAPNLYAALKFTNNQIKAWCDFRPGLKAYVVTAQITIQQALAKAEGK